MSKASTLVDISRNKAPLKRVGGREKLLSAARELFWVKGFESTSPHDLYAFSGVGQGSFYHHFTGKLDLLHAVLEDISSREIAVLEDIVSTESSSLKRLYKYLEIQRDALRGCKLGRFVYESSIEKPEVYEPIRLYFTVVEQFIKSNVQAAQEQGALSRMLDATAITHLLLSSVQGGYIFARANGTPCSLDDSLTASKKLLDSLSPLSAV
ncbi:TetR/AcrR family transcriptional regulator [Craterilacuibacter sinensis]|uniref:TetR family transcriptional regulator n=1 Tax=Craterilacuibacter sinensis TaxID=2686017 RepID=A0A845BQ00_9NEIS|nr:TetR/AcrR family transcriptional regulator [Craterilacuibacter sinensis]MXR37238.1 TetR family transcriptional regulator [Craterilacuibacter sinensis]